MRVFVTGAGGFIGSELVKTLIARGHAVTALVHSPAKAGHLPGEAATVVGDVTRRESFEHAAKDADAIAHLGLPSAESKFRDAYPVWIEGTRNVLEVARERSVRAFVHASGAGGMYRHEPGAWIDETAPEEPFTRATRGRAEADAMVRRAHRDHGVPTVILRPQFVYGRGGAFQKFFVDYMRRGRYRVVGDGSNVLSFVHVRDCAMAYAFAAEAALPWETVLVADDAPVSLREASDATADALGVTRPGSAPPILASLVVGRDGVVLITESVRLRNAKLKQRLGWTPTYPTLRDGLPSVVE